MDNCSQHKKEVAGISDMKVLAEMIGDLHYETLSILLEELCDKLILDEKAWKAKLNWKLHGLQWLHLSNIITKIKKHENYRMRIL